MSCSVESIHGRFFYFFAFGMVGGRCIYVVGRWVVERRCLCISGSCCALLFQKRFSMRHLKKCQVNLTYLFHIFAVYLCVSYISCRYTVAETSVFNSAGLMFKFNSLTSFLDQCLILVVTLVVFASPSWCVTQYTNFTAS